MASPTSSRNKTKSRSSSRRPKSPDAPVLDSETERSSTQPITWVQVAAALQRRWKKMGQQADWSKPKHLPLAWELPAELQSAMAPWLSALSAVLAEGLPTGKQRRRVGQLVREWVAEAPLRLKRWEDGMAPATGLEAVGDRETEAGWRPLGPARLGLEALAVAWLLPCLSSPADRELVEAAFSLLLELSDSGTVPGECPWAASLWQVELPLILAAMLPGEVFPISLRQQALQRLQLQVEELIDGNGLPAHHRLTVFGPLLACWTRVWTLELWIEELRIHTELRDRYRLALQGYLRLLRADGTPLWSEPTHPGVAGGMVAAWLKLGRDAEERAIAEWVCPPRLDFSDIGGPRLKESKLCDAADYTEWGQVAILRQRWKRKSDKLAVNFGQREVQIELANRHSWLCGPFTTEVSWNDQPLPLGERWEEICWQSDEDTVYLEIQNELPGNRGVLQRQFVLARQARLCLIADAVLLSAEPKAAAASDASTQLQHQWRLPFAPGVTGQVAAETREGWLRSGEEQLSVMPIGLPEWRMAPGRGSLSMAADQMVMDYRLPAERLYQAVVIDLDAKRSTKPLSWRMLTVGENLRPVTVDQALGVRLQLHKQQYLIYRSLTPPASRSLLGQNIYSDFYLGQFHPDGTAQTLIMIESS